MPEKLRRSEVVKLTSPHTPEATGKMAPYSTKEEGHPCLPADVTTATTTTTATSRSRARGGRAGQISEISEGLYLSGARAVRQAKIDELGVTCIINATVELPNVPLDGVEVVAVRVSDSPTADIASHLAPIVDMIHGVRMQGGRVLVHCVAGVSRSPCIVLAYLVKHGDMSLREAFQRLREARPNARPNTGFFSQLIEFEREVRGASSVALTEVSGVRVPDVCQEEVKALRDTRWARVITERHSFQRLYA